ncbi:MAG: acyl-CoA synthetase [Chloroflexi bacterium]|nr:acyl-CoA synthetase [Chloroflexota bacterium]MBV9600291.1 acyl-CoA synthetase [Chloroflexota bacterium]
MPDNFWTIAAANPDKTAIVDNDERSHSNADVLATVNQLSHGLRGLGLERGDSIAAMLPNSPEALEVYLAMQQIGLYLTPINYHLVGPEIAYILTDCEAKAFVVHQRYADVVQQALEETGFPADRVFSVGEMPGVNRLADLTDGQPTTAPADRSLGVIMNYTSGTTGRPKGVRRQLPTTAVDETDLGGALTGYNVGRDETDNVHLLACPWYHTAPMVMVAPSVHRGHVVFTMDRFDPERALQLVDRYRVTITHLVPTQFVRLLALPDEVKQRYDVSSLRHVIHGAAPCSPEVKRRMIEWFGPVLDEYYASTEGVGGTIIFSDEWLAKPGSVGKPRHTTTIVVMDEEGNILPAGQVGTIYSTTAGREPFEYYKDPEKTAKSRRGEFRTVGDVGYLDDDGYLFLSDRKSDMIISGGVNIYPAEIESVLITHPRVADVAVFGVPNPEWGEEVKAVVELLPGSPTEPDAMRADILAFLSGRIARYKLPRSIDFMDALPRDPNGKLYKRRLRDPYWAGQQRAI